LQASVSSSNRCLQISASKKHAFLQQESGFRKPAAQTILVAKESKVGLPGTDIGLRAEDPSIAQVMKSLGYATGQFGKNHLGYRNEFLQPFIPKICRR
jgi:arylsulfatase A-like enzyme